jgi:hypothetical protein
VAVTDPVLEALWKNALDRWEDDSAHGAFVEHCQQSDQLVEAAVRYRGMAGDRGRGEQAQKRLNAIAVLALARLEGMRSPSKREPSRAGAYLLIVMFIAASIGLLAYVQTNVP